MDYGSINDPSRGNNNLKEPLFVSDTIKFTFVFIYLSYLHDQQAFGFFLKCVTQAVIFSIPDIEELPNLISLLSSSPEDNMLRHQLERINIMIKIIIPYIILNFFMTLVLHLTWLSTSINDMMPFTTLTNYINGITTNILDNTRWNYDSLFLDIIGESTIISADSSISRSIYLVVLDIIIFFMQISSVLVLRQRLNGHDTNAIDSVVITVI